MSDNVKNTIQNDSDLSDEALESVAGGVIGVDTDGDGIIDGGCTDPFPGGGFPGGGFPGTQPWKL